MKNIATRLFAPAATTVLATLLIAFSAAPASAQELTGKIPFPFAVAQASLPAGEYSLRPVSNSTNGAPLLIRNAATRHGVFAGVNVPIEASKSDKPRLEFLCGSRICRLYRVYYGSRGWQMVQPKRRDRELEQVAVVYLKSEAGL